MIFLKFSELFCQDIMPYFCVMKSLNIHLLEKWYRSNKQTALHGRYILFDDIHPLLENLNTIFKKEILGKSCNGLPIYKLSIGTGLKKVLIWSQMHGNESTGTKALFDLFQFFQSSDAGIIELKDAILKSCTLEIIVLLNPDGAIKFTRENAAGIDLNRDAVDRKAIESQLLRGVLDAYRPQFCFNLHDQRSIFNVEGTKNPATISFLAPSEEETRAITPGRKETMSVIVAMNSLLQQVIPNQVGRYTDEFYPTATGDNFQKLGYNTILIEAGHYKDDYDREETRKFNFFAILQGLYFIGQGDYTNFKPYFNIPNNDKLFLDIIYKNLKVPEGEGFRRADVGVQIVFKEKGGKLVSQKQIEHIGDLSSYATYNLKNAEILNFNELKLSNS
jgi:hypothetical protein